MPPVADIGGAVTTDPAATAGATRSPEPAMGTALTVAAVPVVRTP
jgi:hypothetical protein